MWLVDHQDGCCCSCGVVGWLKVACKGHGQEYMNVLCWVMQFWPISHDVLLAVRVVPGHPVGWLIIVVVLWGWLLVN
jgi:hypothetical protein